MELFSSWYKHFYNHAPDIFSARVVASLCKDLPQDPPSVRDSVVDRTKTKNLFAMMVASL